MAELPPFLSQGEIDTVRCHTSSCVHVDAGFTLAASVRPCSHAAHACGWSCVGALKCPMCSVHKRPVCPSNTRPSSTHPSTAQPTALVRGAPNCAVSAQQARTAAAPTRRRPRGAAMQGCGGGA
eukprot:365904-Chlamydomonas_euryale.AAC.1